MEVRPNVTGPDEYIDVSWEIPAANLPYDSIVAASGNQRKSGGGAASGASARDDMQGDWIGLFRTKQRIDDASNFILTRETAGRAIYDPKANVVRGKVRLRAPRGVGSYDFRYFTKASGEASSDPRRFPVARSPPLTVTVQGNAITEALHFVEKNLKDKKRFAAAAQQLGRLLRQLANLRHPVQHGMKPE